MLIHNKKPIFITFLYLFCYFNTFFMKLYTSAQSPRLETEVDSYIRQSLIDFTYQNFTYIRQVADDTTDLNRNTSSSLSFAIS